LPTVRQVVNSLYPELAEQFPDKPPLYDCISRKISHESICLEKVAEDLWDIFVAKGDISPSGLKNLPSKWLYGRVDVIRQNHSRYHKGTTKTEVIANLTGLRKDEIHLYGEGKMKIIGTMSEELTKLLLLLTQAADPNAKFQTEKFREIFPRPIMRIANSHTFRVESEEGYFLPDIFIESHESAVVEVKNHRQCSIVSASKINEQLGTEKKLYYSQNGERKRRIYYKVAVLHGPQNVVEKMASLISPEIRVFWGEEFEESFDRAVLAAEAFLPCKPVEMMDIYRNVTCTPHLILINGQQHRLNYALEMLKILNENLANGGALNAVPVSVLGKKGHERRNDKGYFQLLGFSLDTIAGTQTTEYVTRNLEFLDEKQLLVDLETTGVARDSQIITVGLARREGEQFKIDIAFARNPWEEAAILQYLSEIAPRFSKLVTYNGRIFDCQLMENRANEYDLPAQAWEHHVDVYRDAIAKSKRELGLKSAGLKQIDMLLGNERTDLPGAQIPNLYYRYLYKGEDFSPAIEHNVLDMVSLAAAFIFAKKELEYKFEGRRTK